MKKQKYKVVSLFSGCGGLDLGFVGGFNFLGKNYSKLNYEIIWANDFEPSACLTFRNNFKEDIVCGDINVVLKGKNNLLDKELPKNADIVLGGFPCQDFSLAGKRRGFNNEKRGLLYKSMMEVIKRVRPKVFLAENVKGLLSMNGGEAFKTIIKDFETLGYEISAQLYLASEFGVPQNRERIIIVGTKKGMLPQFIHPKALFKKEQAITAEQAIGDLQNVEEGFLPNHYWSKAKLTNGQGNNKINPNKPGPTMRSEHHGNIEFHWKAKRRLSAREAARIQSFPDDFIFYPSTSSAYKQIGNAVPPVLAWQVAKSLQNFLDKHL